MNKMIIRVEVDAKDVARGVAVAKGQVQGLEREVEKTNNASIRAAASFGKYLVTAAAGAAAKAVKDQLELAAAIRDVQRESGATVDQATSLKAVLDVLGVPVEALSGAFRTLASNMASSPEMFRELGVETRDAAGHARDAFDVFMDVRKVLADSRGDAATLAAAQALLGRGYQDLLPLLNATDEEMRILNQAAQTSGLVLGETAVQGAERFGDALNGLLVSVQGLAQSIAEDLIPQLASMAEAAAVGIDTLNALRTTPHANASQGVPFFSGLANVLGGAFDALTGNPTDQLRRVNDQVNAQEKAREAISAILTRQRAALGTTRAGSSLAGRIGSEKAAIDAMRQEAEDAIDALRDSLKGYEREREALIDLVEAESEAFQRAHEVALRAIEDEVRARDDAFETLDRARSEEIDALRAQIRGTQELIDLERRRAALAEAEGDAEAERKVEIFRSAGQSANDYARAVSAQQRRIADADRRVVDLRQSLEEDSSRAILEARIRVIEEERQASRRAHDEFRRGAEDRSRALRDEMELEQQATRVRLDAIRSELNAERDRVSDAIDGIRRHTAEAIAGAQAIINALNAIPRSISTVHTTTTSGGGGGGGAVPVTVDGALAHRKGEQQAGGQLDLHSARALKESLLGRNAAYEEYAGYVGRTAASVENEIRNSAEWQMKTAIAGGHVGGSYLTEFDTPQVARFNEPVLMTGISGRRYGIAAAHGSEEVAFGGVGRAAVSMPQSAPIVSTVNAYGIGVREAAKLIARENERAMARRAGHGYGLRRR